MINERREALILWKEVFGEPEDPDLAEETLVERYENESRDRDRSKEG